MIVEAVLRVAVKDGDQQVVDLDNVKVEKKAGGSIQNSRLVSGIVLDKEVVHSGMPTKIANAKIVLLNAAMEIEKTEMSSEIRITDPAQMQMYLEEENRMLKEMVDKLQQAGANVLLCQKGIDDIAQHYLAKSGILAVRRVKESDMTKLAKATGGRVISNVDDLAPDDLGTAQQVKQEKVEADNWVFIEGCSNPQSVTLLLRGGTQRVVDEADRSIHDALMVVKDVIEKPAIVAGGGSPEAYVSSRLKDWADIFDGREQLAVKKYAEALEVIPITIAENAGMNPIDTIANLRAQHSQGLKWTGIDAKNSTITNMLEQSIVEPVIVKEQIIKSATETVCMVLRIDDVIAVSGAPGGDNPMG